MSGILLEWVVLLCGNVFMNLCQELLKLYWMELLLLNVRLLFTATESSSKVTCGSGSYLLMGRERNCFYFRYRQERYSTKGVKTKHIMLHIGGTNFRLLRIQLGGQKVNSWS
ncbi:hypothetical protein LXL04_020550 [Taraxacum kok-saghyz]